MPTACARTVGCRLKSDLRRLNLAQKKESVALSPRDEINAIRKKLRHLTFESVVKAWLDTGNRRLNAVMGSEELGLAFGKMVELFGPESQGKTMIALLLAALAQANGAKVAWVDLENSFDDDWVKAQGLDPELVYLFQPQLGYFGGGSDDDDDEDAKKKKRKKRPRLQTAEELFEEVEEWMAATHQAAPDGRLLVVVDSIAAALVDVEAQGGITDQNMFTNTALSRFLSKLLRRWVALASSYNAMMIFINQVRTSPNQRFGNPENTPGGRALKFYCSVRVRVRRGKHQGRLLQGRKVIGLSGILTNVKNKAGGKSLEGATAGFETRFGKQSWRFPSIQELKQKEAVSDDED